MFAVVRTGGKQYRVAAGDKIVVDSMGGEAGDVLRLDDVLFAGSGDAAGLTVEARIIAQAKADKVIVFKKKRRHNYRRKNGHRQQHTILRITAVGDDTIETAQARQAASQQAGMAASGGADEAPASSASRRASSRACALRSIDLLGMQATYGHSPPTRSASTSATDRPCAARVVAMLSPAEPAPRTTTLTGWNSARGSGG